MYTYIMYLHRLQCVDVGWLFSTQFCVPVFTDVLFSAKQLND